MKAIVIDGGTGGPDALRIAEVPDPVPQPGEVLLRVAATALNRADLLQRIGRYPPPAGASPLLGLEAAGTVESLSPHRPSSAGAATYPVPPLRPGDRVMALLPGGGYAERAAVPADHLMPVPDGMSLEHAAAVPEAFLTAWLELVVLGGLREGGRLAPVGEPLDRDDREPAPAAGTPDGRAIVLVHAGGSGVGTAAIQVARQLGARVFASAGGSEKCDLCRQLGAEAAIDHRTCPDLAAELSRLTAGRGVDVVLDLVGAVHARANVDALAVGGRILLVGTVGGGRAEFNLNAMLAKRAVMIGSTLRNRSAAEKAGLVRRFAEWGLPRLADGRLRPVVGRVLPWSRAGEAHALLESGAVAGKVVLRVGE